MFKPPLQVATIATCYGGPQAGLKALARTRQGRNDSGGRQRRCGAARARQDLKAGAGREARASAGMFNGRQANQGSADQRRSR